MRQDELAYSSILGEGNWKEIWGEEGRGWGGQIKFQDFLMTEEKFGDPKGVWQPFLGKAKAQLPEICIGINSKPVKGRLTP